MSLYTEEDAKAEWRRVCKQWNDAFGEDPGSIRQDTYAEWQIMLHGEWLPLTFALSELGDGTLIERVKVHLQQEAA